MAVAAKKSGRRKSTAKKATSKKAVAKVGTAPKGKIANAALPPEHEQRALLVNELHARPFEALAAPARLSTYAMLSGEEGGNADRAHLTKLCARFGIAPPLADANYFTADFGHFRLRWERHTEFTSYTVMREVPFDPEANGDRGLFTRKAADQVPAEWLAGMPGEMLQALHIEILAAEQDDPSPRELAECFSADSLVSSLISDESAQLWTDLRLHSDGHGRVLFKYSDMSPRKAGRVLQRVSEILSYQVLALLALPVARSTGEELARIDKALALLTAEMARRTGLSPQERDHALLGRLTQLSAEIEELASVSSYRFSAARAYNAVISERIGELREERAESYPLMSEFLVRRLAPAMRTCDSVSDRLADMSRRATRAANLLRTRVDFALERQNHQLLDSMDKRAKLQLRLQQTVEGLSVVAISYYMLGLVLYGAKAAHKAGLPLEPTLAAGVALPIVVLGVWGFVRRLRRHLDNQSETEE